MGVPLSVGGDARDHAERRPLRLLWLIDSLTMGGAESLAVAFANACAAAQIELTVCARATIGGNPLEKELQAIGIRTLNLEARRLLDFRAFRTLLRVLRTGRFDIIHAHLAYSAVWAAFASRLTATPFVATLHETPAAAPPMKERIRRLLMRVLLNRFASRIIAVSASLRRDLVAMLRLDPQKVAVIPNGIELPEVETINHPELRKSLRVGTTSPIIATVAVLRDGKGIDVLIRAARTVLDSIPEVAFVIAGDGPMRQPWQRLAEGSGVARSFHWLGFRRDVDTVLAECDLFVLPSLNDAFPTAILEAMRARLPVIASKVGGIPEIVVDGETGWLVPPGDPEALGAAIVRALHDPPSLKRAGNAGAERLRSEFAVGIWIDRLRGLYAEVVRSDR